MPCAGLQAVRIGGYAVRRTHWEIGPMAVCLLSVADMEEYVDREALLRGDALRDPPYWMHVWPGARMLARLVAGARVEGCRVLELGCGLGLPGLVAALRGARVTLADREREALEFAMANARENGCRVRAVQCDLRAPAVRGPFDLCLAADVSYEEGLAEAVSSVLAATLAANGRAWCAESVRTRDGWLRAACEARGLAVAEFDAQEVEEDHPVWVRVSEVRRR